jgi:hypothetical protein
LIERDLRANAFAFVARENRCTLFRIMLQGRYLTSFNETGPRARGRSSGLG